MTMVERYAGISGVVGGALWAVTPLRQPIFDAGRTPEEGLGVFRTYNVVLLLIAVLLTVALLRLRSSGAGRLFAIGWWTILVGHVLLFLGSVPAVVLGDEPRDLVMGGQDLGFLGAMVAGLGALLVGLSLLRQSANVPRVAAWLFVLTMPLGFVLLSLMDAAGASEDVVGLPLTVLYGGAWVVLGSSWMRETQAQAQSSQAAAA